MQLKTGGKTAKIDCLINTANKSSMAETRLG